MGRKVDECEDKHSVVVITSALHAEGRGFKPHCLYSFYYILLLIMKPNNTPTHKKYDDEETKGFIELQTVKENDGKLSRLERNVSAIK